MPWWMLSSSEQGSPETWFLKTATSGPWSGARPSCHRSLQNRPAKHPRQNRSAFLSEPTLSRLQEFRLRPDLFQVIQVLLVGPFRERRRQGAKGNQPAVGARPAPTTDFPV